MCNTQGISTDVICLFIQKKACNNSGVVGIGLRASRIRLQSRMLGDE